MTENEKKEDTSIEKLPALEKACPECDGRGYWLHKGQTRIKCDNCKGKGEVLTPFGEQVLNLVWRHFSGLMRLPDDD